MNSIRNKLVTGLIALMAVLGLGTVGWLNWRLDTVYAHLEQENATDDFSRLLRAVDARLQQQFDQTKAWAVWTEMAAFVHDHNRAFVEQNLNPESIEATGHAWMAVMDLDGHLIQQVSSEKPDSKDIGSLLDGPYGATLRTLPAPGQPGCGLGRVQDIWLVLCRNSIHDNSGKGAAQGILASAWRLPPQVLSDLSKQTGLTFALEPSSVPAAKDLQTGPVQTSGFGQAALAVDVGTSQVDIRWPVLDIAGRAVGHLRLESTRSLTQHAKAELQTMGWQLLLLFSVIALGILVMLDRVVVARLMRFSAEMRAIHKNHQWERRVTVAKNDEISRLAAETNDLLGIIQTQFEDLKTLSETDTLTGLANRLASAKRLHLEFVRMKRTQHAYTVMVLDIDHFKRINDSYGHATGDLALQRIARILLASLRDNDFVARFGGEEFLIILPGTTMEAAIRVAEKIRQAVEASTDPVSGSTTVSLGLALAAPNDADEDTAVRQADHWLYEAKRSGRNKLMWDPGYRLDTGG